MMKTEHRQAARPPQTGSPEAGHADGETRIIVRRRKAKKGDRSEQTRASAFVYSCPGKIWDAIVWNCLRSGEHPAKAIKDALQAYLKERGWREPPPAKVLIATAEQPAPRVAEAEPPLNP